MYFNFYVGLKPLAVVLIQKAPHLDVALNGPAVRTDRLASVQQQLSQVLATVAVDTSGVLACLRVQIAISTPLPQR